MLSRLIRLIPCLLLAGSAFAQTNPWTSLVRGSWVQTGAAAPGDVTLASGETVAQIVISDDENAAVHQAATFLAGDIEKISGRRPELVKTPTDGKVNIHMVTLGRGEVPAAVNASPMQGQWESYRIATEGRNVWLVGSNPRGTAFAAYTLSERLGIDPIYIWTGYQPEHHNPLVLKRTSFSQGPPTFRYRGFFHDDEDLLPRPFDANGYPLQTGDVPLIWYKRFFETALRLRMNMVAPYTRVHRRFEVQKLASDWGLYYTSHHYDILLSNPFGLTIFNLAAERGVQPNYDWFTNREGMLTFWRGGLTENKDIDAIWPVGMRGTSDRPFTFPPNTSDEKKAATFREVIGEQVKMAHAAQPHPLLTFTMYSEMLPAYQRDPAAFDLPDDVMIIWPDDNDGHMRGLPASVGKWKHGVYYHLAYLGGNLSKQTTHTETPTVVADEFQKIVKAGATEYMLVNVSEVRDYVMGARMIGDICWDAPAVYGAPKPAERYTAWWSREYFGSSAKAVESAYTQYFELLDKPDTLWNAMNTIQTLIDRLYLKVAGKPFEPLAADAVTELQSRAKLLDAALASEQQAETGMSRDQQRFLSIDDGLGVKIAQRQTHAALKLEEALRAPDSTAMWRLAGEAYTYLETLETDFARGEYPPFDRWYHETWIRSERSANNPHRAYNQLRAFIGTDGRDERPPAPAFPRGPFPGRGPGRGQAPGPGRGQSPR
ncbi:MAG TPA: glycosyl hydrolase 115 family protein [Verrucomicrobiae bacterium]|nr:glycosyl hydrolase 115 family protein [Verrucomicrobiae bacterium]